MHSEYTLSAPKPCPSHIEELTSVSNYQITTSKTCTFKWTDAKVVCVLPLQPKRQVHGATHCSCFGVHS